ncbi:MAG TPA: universal stress protein [Chloroflexota bacterium]
MAPHDAPALLPGASPPASGPTVPLTEVERTSMATQTILVPLDGSPQSNAALPLARTLARATDGAITLLRVMSRDDPTTTGYATSNLRKIADELRDSGLDVDSVVRHGSVADEILSEVRVRGATIVVMRTHGRAGVERAFLGSVADQVVARCPVPVVLMRPGERRITGIHTLLVPVDGSPGGTLALGTAVALARATGASITLVQVSVPIAMQTMVAYEYGGMGYYGPEWDDESLASAKAYVDGLVRHLRKDGLTAHAQAFSAPNAAHGIVDAADKNVADLIVMSTRALTGPARTLLGSVANLVVRSAHCPVLLVHRTSDSEASPAPAADTAADPAAVGT